MTIDSEGIHHSWPFYKVFVDDSPPKMYDIDYRSVAKDCGKAKKTCLKQCVGLGQ